MKTFLVGMMFSGEREYTQALASLKSQTFTDWDLVEIKNLPNKQAHDTLYSTFMREARNYGFFLKLDADMVFRDTRSLTTLADLIRRMTDHDVVTMDVFDWPAGILIPGLPTFSNRVKWAVNPDQLMVDHAPMYSGQARRIWEPPAPLVDHMVNPSRFQAFRYGVHRAFKAIQPDRAEKKLWRGLLHWTILKNVWRRYEVAGDDRRLWVLLGAETVFSEGPHDRLRLLENYGGDYARALFEELAQRPAGKYLIEIRRTWSNELINDARWVGLWNAKPWIIRQTRADISEESVLP